MALSQEFYPSMRGSVIPEARSSFPSSEVIFAKDPSSLQAIHMGKLSGVRITAEEASSYKALREKPLNGAGLLKSDQALMAEDVLTGEKSAQFKKAYPQIFPPFQ